MFSFFKQWNRKTKSLFKPVILVTGCSSGLGLELAKLLYRCTNYRVVITARASSFHILKARFTENERFWMLPLDVTIESERKWVIQQIEERWEEVHILINNAGICYRSVIEHMTAADEQVQMNTNYLGPMALVRLVLPKMRQRGRGKIINVSSVSGMLAMPTMGSYTASKHALEGATEALWYEMKPLGINVCLVQPGFINSTSFQRVKSTDDSQVSWREKGPYSDYYLHMTPFIQKLMELSPSSPREIAFKILSVIRTENPPLWVPATLDAMVFYYLRRILPRQLLLNILFAALPKSRTWGRTYSKARNLRKKSMQRPKIVERKIKSSRDPFVSL